ncbi:MAG: PAS domain-containing protein, partial [Arenicellales bacterium]
MKIPDSAVLSRVLDGLKQAVLLSDSAKTVRFMNGAAEDLLHFSAQRAVGQPVMDVVPLGMILQAALIAGAEGTTTTLRQTPLRRANPPS